MYDLQKRLVKFSASIILNVGGLNRSFASEHLIKRLIRSSSSAALNYGEAQAAESRKDFVQKMKLCLKELRESQVNLQILIESELIKDVDGFYSIIKESKELVAVFTSSIKTLGK
ncbi:four helix bundle protein [Aquimarina brevivitae]|uniref:four helix bundle protein n=1 Tax=Aquimarina brevivitae TaxID=323412 RepID=UPI0010299F33|nr:four helix bundle protein [Aquimarina brevivitae]